jgi:hypothetical protein
MARYRMLLVGAAASGALAVGLAEAAPPAPFEAAPAGHEAALSKLVTEAAQGKFDEGALTPQLAAAVQAQLPVAKAELSALGPLRAVTFERRNSQGAEIYLTTFEHGALEWAFAMGPDGRISNAMYRAAPKP